MELDLETKDSAPSSMCPLLPFDWFVFASLRLECAGLTRSIFYSSGHSVLTPRSTKSRATAGASPSLLPPRSSSSFLICGTYLSPKDAVLPARMLVVIAPSPSSTPLVKVLRARTLELSYSGSSLSCSYTFPSPSMLTSSAIQTDGHQRRRHRRHTLSSVTGAVFACVTQLGYTWTCCGVKHNGGGGGNVARDEKSSRLGIPKVLGVRLLSVAILLQSRYRNITRRGRGEE
jgi:hypothetical protein